MKFFAQVSFLVLAAGALADYAPAATEKNDQPATEPSHHESQPASKPYYDGTQPATKPSHDESQPASKPYQDGNQPASKPSHDESQPASKPYQDGNQPAPKPSHDESQSASKPYQDGNQPASKPSHDEKSDQSAFKPYHDENSIIHYLHQIKYALKGEVEAYESDHDDLNKILSASDKAFEQIQTTVKGLNAAKSYYSKDDAEALSDFIHHAHQTEKRLLKNDKEIVHEVQEKKLCKKFLEKMNTNLDLATKFLKDTVPKLPNQEYKEDITAEQAYLLQFIQERVNLYSGDSCKAAATYY